MPSAESYGQMIAALRAEAEAFGAAEGKTDELAASRRALRVVMQWLRRDPEVLDGKLVRPLAVLANDAWDAARGATVERLEHAPERPGPPTGMAHETVQGTMAYALEIMAETRMGETRALNWVAAEARKAGITDENRQADNRETTEDLALADNARQGAGRGDRRI